MPQPRRSARIPSRPSSREGLYDPAFERDGVVFDQPDYNFPLLACLLRVATESGNRLRVLDFGGSLGSTYFQCRPFLGGVSELRWTVVEQPQFVECGRREFEDGEVQALAFRSRSAAVGTVSVQRGRASLWVDGREGADQRELDWA